jgi:hypothetical protein
MHNCRRAVKHCKERALRHIRDREVSTNPYNADHDVINYGGANRERGKDRAAAVHRHHWNWLIARRQLMRIRVEPHSDDVTAAPRSLYLDGRRIDIAETIDRWYGPDYRYVKVNGLDGAVYILRFDETRDEWDLTMFVSARGQALAARSV